MKRMVTAALCAAAVLLSPTARAEELKIGLAASTTSMDPQFYVGGPNSAMARNMFDGLVNQDQKQQIQPAIAESWTLIDDLTWEFKIREGVRFHDGTGLDAADVAASLRRIPLAATNSPSSFIAYVQDIAEITVPDSRTVRIRTVKPAPLLLNNLSRIAIMPARLEKVPPDQFNTSKNVIGTGPFRFVSWAPDDHVTLERFDGYWGTPAKWDRVVFRVFKNSSARVAALLSGDVDMIDNVPTADMRHVTGNKSIRTTTVSSNRVMYLHMDQTREISPFSVGSDKKNPLVSRDVRRALSLSINRQALVDRVMDGQGIPAGQLVPEGYFGYVPELKVDAYDPDTARKMLNDAGAGKGFTLTFHATNDRYPNDSKIAQAVGQMFSRVGIKMDVATLPGSVYFSRASALEFSLIMGGAAVETGEASGVLGPLLETFGSKAGQGNRGRYSNPEFDRVLNEARVTLDDGARSALLQKAMTIAMDEAGVIPLFFIANTWAMKPGISYPGRTDGYTLASEVE